MGHLGQPQRSMGQRQRAGTCKMGTGLQTPGYLGVIQTRLAAIRFHAWNLEHYPNHLLQIRARPSTTAAFLGQNERACENIPPVPQSLYSTT